MAEELATTGTPGPATPTSEEDDPIAIKVEKWVDSRKEHWKQRFKEVRRNRRVARGELHRVEPDTEMPRLVRANLIHSTLQGLIPHIYAQNPEISVSPSEAVGDDRYGSIKGFARTLEVLLAHRFVKEGALKKRAKRAVRQALISRIGWSKITYQREFTEDPDIRSRIEDVQEQLAALDRLERELTDDVEAADEDAKRQELLDLANALEQQLEVVIAEGLVIDIVRADRLIFDVNIDSLDEFPRCRMVVQEIPMLVEEAEEKCGMKMEGATTYMMHEEQANDGDLEDLQVGGGDASRMAQHVLVHEAWNRITRNVYTTVKGMKKQVKEPYVPDAVGERWYPFFPLTFNLIDGYTWPLALPDLILELSHEYNQTRTQQAEHRELSVPHWIADKQLDRDSLERYRDAELGEVVLVDANGKPIKQVIDVANPPPYNPALYDTLPVRADIDIMTGLQDANRGTVTQAKTATEAEILQTGLVSRTGEMRDTIEDWIEEQAQYSSEIFLQVLTIAQVIRVAGEQAVWPQLSKREVFDLVVVEVRAGTTGKPDKSRERQQWGELLPVVENLIEKAEMRAFQGLDPRPQIELLRMTLKRFEERIDLEEFLPELLKQFLSATTQPQQLLQQQLGAGASMGGPPALPFASSAGGVLMPRPNVSGPSMPVEGPPTLQ